MKVDVIGAGTMGGGIAQAFAQVDSYEVYLYDLTGTFAEGGGKRIEKGLAGCVAKGKLSQKEMDKILDRIHAGTKNICKDCDLVTETTIENMQIKRQTFKELSEIYKKDCLSATNTSSLSVTKIGAGLGRPVTDMHLFNPASVMKLVKMISGLDTLQEDLDHITRIAEGISKTIVPTQEFAGFAVNRILVPMTNEAIDVYADNNVPAGKTDETMKLSTNHLMGPLAPDDLIDLDVVLAIMEVLQSETDDTKYRPYPELRKMVRGGRPGRKTGRGFYDYTK